LIEDDIKKIDERLETLTTKFDVLAKLVDNLSEYLEITAEKVAILKKQVKNIV
jgi:hypothetical protein